MAPWRLVPNGHVFAELWPGPFVSRLGFATPPRDSRLDWATPPRVVGGGGLPLLGAEGRVPGSPDRHSASTGSQSGRRQTPADRLGPRPNLVLISYEHTAPAANPAAAGPTPPDRQPGWPAS